MGRATQSAYESIKTRILGGAYEPGKKLSEEDLAAAVGVSRTPVREALRRLHAEGLVDWEANRGATVPAWREQDLEEIFELRALLEGYGAELAATRITPEEIARLRELCAEMEGYAAGQRRDRADRIAVCNAQFHEIILGAGRNRRLSALLGAVVQTPLVNRTFRRYDEAAMARSMSHHRELIDAFEARDRAWAGSVMRAHILAARATLGTP
ncbi:GntR family transcriptional regulator [Micromonospora aurantiaca]|uniref:GntR family transcriptional regulator n=2 Tax=Micromonospora TaxID=1873 RepID=A0AAW4JI79_9ACTN|nr:MULTISPECIES: GntR family transcriptional regulator [Micromonospora]ADL47280.1 GntR domain protein [Micromonospora aurantiaca ATCC 27029]ADU10121.1 transcriptional regulator, GntR family [Micromonospora sp. L5]AXH93195.1 GntR family transcriptional regulator [Micromonospora aurantiaca]KAB1118544.1 GntR family transcriptional regulator [Micromonospora aurantiaca]KAB1910198.1 GntR family transcriptional regulator [Micromonospora sp. AMSO1212t]